MATFQSTQALLHRAGNDNHTAGEEEARRSLALFPSEPAAFDFAGLGYRELGVRFVPETGALWMRFTHPDRPCFTPGLLAEMSDLERRISSCGTLGAMPSDFRYLVRASARPDIWSYGGDLALFVDLVRRRAANELRDYAHRCCELLYRNYRSFDVPITTIGLVQGDALGGGFESLLSDDIIIAERGVRMGLPEILFNLFPGMGAYSFLARKLGSGLARRMITSGELYTAEQLYEMGVVDVLAAPGEGEAAVHQFMVKNERRRRTFDVLRAVDRRSDEVTLEELLDVTELWVQRALELEAQDLRKMERLVQSQARRLAG